MIRPARLLVALSAAALLFACGFARSATPAWTWTPELAPTGPLVAVVSLPRQEIVVYRNGLRIGRSPISSGRKGHETPVGVFTILQKEVEHRSNLYDDAPMPFMQRLTWDGIALHAGRLPGYPASHGCIRLPEDFAKRLYAVTRPGSVVVVAGRDAVPSLLAAPGLLAAVDARNGAALPPDAPLDWQPQRSPSGPLSIVISTADGRVVATRNGVRIGSAPIDASSAGLRGTRAWVMLDGAGVGTSLAVPGRAARRWLAIGVAGTKQDTAAVDAALRSGRLAFPREFSEKLYDELAPGTTVILTDEPMGVPSDTPLDLEGVR
ncbi:L,D-transpeptidase family protein [Lysobacter xanthus]